MTYKPFVGLGDINIVLTHWNQNVLAGDLNQGDPTTYGFFSLEELGRVLTDWNAGTPPAATVVPELPSWAHFAPVRAWEGFEVCAKSVRLRKRPLKAAAAKA